MLSMATGSTPSSMPKTSVSYDGGRIDSCIECHKQYSSTDYVTRAYVNQE